MSTTNFVDNTTVIYASWLNDVDAHVYDQVAGAHVASNITNTPSGNISSTTVQAAINELDTEKIATSAIGVSVQAYDADTTKNDATNTFTADNTFNANLNVSGTLYADGDISKTGAVGLTISSPATTGIILSPGGSERLRVTSDGRVYGTAIHNNAGAVTGTTNQYVASGTYTPTITNTTNISASTPRQAQWLRVGNVVTVSGQLDCTTSATVASEIGVSLPIASAFTTAYQLGGTGHTQNSTEDQWIQADATNDRAKFNWTALSASARTVVYTFTYEVL